MSAQELLGHCVELFQSNREGVTALVAHLERYGYQAPPGARREPEDPCASASAPASTYGLDELCLDEGKGEGRAAGGLGMGRLAAVARRCTRGVHWAACCAAQLTLINARWCALTLCRRRR